MPVPSRAAPPRPGWAQSSLDWSGDGLTNIPEAAVPVVRKLKRHARVLLKGEEREFFLDKLPEGSAGVEVGVWKGDLSAMILRKVRPTTLMLVDPWMFDPRFAESLFGGKATQSQADMDAIFQKVQGRFSAEVARGVVSIHRNTSAEAAAATADESVDWVYIDANHAYEFVLEDLRSWYPKVRPGGLVAGDDYDRPGTWWGDGVTKAVNEFVKAEPVVVDAIANHQFVLRKVA